MARYYRISTYSKKDGKRVLMWETFTSRKRAQAFADELNRLIPTAAAEVVKRNTAW